MNWEQVSPSIRTGGKLSYGLWKVWVPGVGVGIVGEDPRYKPYYHWEIYIATPHGDTTDWPMFEGEHHTRREAMQEVESALSMIDEVD